ncbi:MAG: SMC-Scp complex subunit ScpB [Nitrospinae bacterium]|nr:SMC-Scp complex subunit ScpB [Nitrospinota bacterium]
MERNDALRAIEAVLFVSDSPVTLESLQTVLEGLKKDEVREMLAELSAKFEDHGIEVVEIAEGYQLRTKSECGEWVKKFHKISRSTKLSQAALETLSMIAYRQPITRQEIEDIRGVDSSGVIKNLLDKNLVRSLGRKKVPGKPVTFGTTKKFLEYFGLVKLSDLPTLKDFPADEGGATQENLRFDELTQTRIEDLEPLDENEDEFNPDEEKLFDGAAVESEEEENNEADGKDQASKNSR